MDIQKRKVLIHFLILVSCLCPFLLFGQVTDVPLNISYADSIKRVTGLGLMNGDEEGFFRPNATITREQFVKIVIQALNIEDLAGGYKTLNVFNDVDASSWSRPYINLAYKQGLIKAENDGKFRPEDNITFEEAVTMVMKALGYRETVVTDKWPDNYLGKAWANGLTLGINIKSNEDLPRWAAAMLVDRLWLELSQKKRIGTLETTLADSPGLYTNCIILGNDETNKNLADGQILTDQGIFYLSHNISELKIGSKYRLIIDEDTVLLAYDELTNLKKVTVKSINEAGVTYQRGSALKRIALPDKTTYYYNGAKVDYSRLTKVIKLNSSLVFAYNRYRTGYEYVVILDPVYSKPEVAVNFKPDSYTLGSIKFSGQTPIVRNGKLIDRTQIKEKDVVCQVTDIWGDNEYLLVTGNKAIGKIEAVLPHRLSPVSIQIKEQTYELAKEMDLTKINDSIGAFDDKTEVMVLLGHDNKVVDVLKYEHDAGEETELIILGNQETSEQLSLHQVLTDKGVYRLKDNLTVELGKKYSLAIYKKEIVQVYSEINAVEKKAVENIIENVVTCRKGEEGENFILPDHLEYYYNGEKQSYSLIGKVLDYNSTIIFGYDAVGADYEYAVILNPIYSEPEIVKGVAHDYNPPILKDGKLIEAGEIQENDVVYAISNKSDENKYLLVIDHRVQGEITNFLPHALSPKIVQVNGLSFNLSKYFDLGKIHYRTGTLKVGDTVMLILGKDGRIIDIEKVD